MNSVEDVTLRRLRTISRNLTDICDQGIDPAFEAASCEDRMRILFDAVGVMPSTTHVLSQIDKTKPWGPSNVCWRENCNTVKTLHAGDWSPTAQCIECKCFRTKIVHVDSAKGIREHLCACGRRFATEMEDLADYDNHTAAEVLTHNGITQTLSAWASERNMTPQALRARIANGWSVEDALDTPIHGWWQRLEKLTFKGITQTVEQWASDLGVTSGTIRKRISSGLSVQDALSTAGRLPSPKTVRKNQTLQRHRSNRSMLSCNGRTQSVAEWSKETGISDALIRRRLKLGWTVKRTLETPASPRRMLTWGGRTQSVGQWARELDITVQLIAHRLRRGWTASEIFETPAGVPRKKSGGDQK